jgi:hypothetical protein
MSTGEPIFERIQTVRAPGAVTALDAEGTNPEFCVEFQADGTIPFAQVIIWCNGTSHVVSASEQPDKPHTYVAQIPARLCRADRVTLQVEGCRQSNISEAGAQDWIKLFVELEIRRPIVVAALASLTTSAARIYFGIHKHMHQPYYRATEPAYWDGEIDDIFRTRHGAYSDYIPDAIERYVRGNLPHAGLSTSFSGSLIEQLQRCDRENLCGGQFKNWSQRLRETAMLRTELGNPRMDFTAFGYFHPLMPLLPHRDIVRSIRAHRQLVRDSVGTDVSPILFPPETAFHVRMIPALLEAGVSAVIYDSIHRFRACQDYPYGGANEGMLPPNPSEQENPHASDWLHLQNVWAASPISPAQLRPSWVRYEGPDGHEYRIIGIPAERYLGNEDARGGFGALQYPSVLGQLRDNIIEHDSFDPKHPPFFLLHSDGDNYGGGADSYYRHNTEKLVDWLRADARFELTTIRDYLDRFPPDPLDVIHVEPGSWSGADNGDPQFSKWFSRLEADYSPDINSWAVLTMLQNVVHALEDQHPESSALARASRLLLTAETSCYWYWTGQEVWDAQVTLAANAAYAALEADLSELKNRDSTGPTIFPPWVLPANPGGLGWSHQGLQRAVRNGILYTLVGDICDVQSVEAIIKRDAGDLVVPLVDCGPYPSRTGPRRVAHAFKCQLPAGAGSIRYFLRAVDTRGNASLSSLERICLA